MILKRIARKAVREFRKRFPGKGKLLARSPEFYSLIARGSRVERLASGFQFTEGPIWLAQNGCLLFSDIPAARIYKFDRNRSVTVFRENSNESNGLTLDQWGRLIACEHASRRVTRTEPDGSITVLAESYEGKRLNNPNDVVVKRDGSIYFTDPVWSKAKESVPAAVYRLDPKTHELQGVAFGLQKPNGLAFSPDELRLYVDDSGARKLMAYDVAPDGTLRNGRVFCDMDIPESGSPDGMKVDEKGNIYCTGPVGVWVISPEGEHLGTIVIPEQPANCAWGESDRHWLYITARTSIYRIRVLVPGIPQLQP